MARLILMRILLPGFILSGKAGALVEVRPRVPTSSRTGTGFEWTLKLKSYASLDDQSDSHSASAPSTRRRFSAHVLELCGATAALLSSEPVTAKSSQEADDKAKLAKGYDRLNYLLDNWEKETTICGQTDNPYTGNKGCDRTPLKVMEYMGYKSMEDPLFKAEKTMRRLEPLVPTDRESEFLEAMEKWVENANEASDMAYVSSWGEANPGGGKDRVEYFIERAKINVTNARDVLAKVINILKINVS